MPQGWRIVARSDPGYFFHAATQQSAGEKRYQPGGWRTGCPEILVIGQQPCAAQIDLPLAAQALPPQRRHFGDRLGRLGDLPTQSVFGATVNDALGTNGLASAQLLALNQ